MGSSLNSFKMESFIGDDDDDDDDDDDENEDANTLLTRRVGTESLISSTWLI